MVNNGGMADGWRVEITTGGGFTGRGIGTVDARGSAGPRLADRRGQTDDRDARIAGAVAKARPERWTADYGRSAGADEVQYTLTLARGGSSWKVSWTDASVGELPSDLRELFDAAWETRR